MIEAGDVTVDGVARKGGYKLHDGEDVVVVLRLPVPVQAVAQDLPLDILYEDHDLIVVNKAVGMVVHPAPGHPHGTLVNALLGHCKDLSGIGGALRPGIVHRLDKDTSGAMVATKNDATHRAFVEMFQTGKGDVLIREYLAVVAPPPRGSRGTFDTLYGRHKTHRKKFSSKVERGKRAVTHWEVEQRFGSAAALVRCRLATGRTHQIRVHFADNGSPVVGDAMYSRRRTLGDHIDRQALHAAVLAFPHPSTHERLRFEAPLPADMQSLLDVLTANR